MHMKLQRLRSNGVFMKNLRLDVTPELIFKPRFVRGVDDRALIDEVQGFSLYVEGMDKEPVLMVMKTYNLTSKTVGEVEDVPRELLSAAIACEGARGVGGMYPLDEPLTAWIKRELGID